MRCPLRCGSGALAAEAHVPLETRYLISQQLFEVALELLSHKCVKHRTNATVNVGYVPSHIQCVVQTVRGTPLNLTCAGDLDGLQEDDNIVGCPANEKGKNNDKNQLDCATLFPQLGGQDADGNADVAVHHHEKWEKEEEQELLVITDQTPALHDVVRVSRLLTHQAIQWTLPNSPENQLLHTCGNTDNPDCQSCNYGICPLSALSSCNCMHNCKIPVKCHESEKKDRTVEANKVGTADHFTQRLTKNPLRKMVRGPERKTGSKQNVGEDQIQEEDISNCVELLILVDDKQDEAVAKITQEKVNVVEHWDKSGTKVVDI